MSTEGIQYKKYRHWIYFVDINEWKKTIDIDIDFYNNK